MPDKTHHFPYLYIIYDPPAKTVPWLSVCLGPDGKVLAAETFETLAGALDYMAVSVDVFVEAPEKRRGQRVWHVKLTG